jgi:hypothetical protein
MIIGCALLLGAIACDKKEEQTSTVTTPEPDQPIPAATAPAAPEPPPMAEVSVEADFEEKAAEEITATNLETELDKVEKEIAAE